MRMLLVSMVYFLSCHGVAAAQNLSGLRIGAPTSSTENLGTAPVALNHNGPFTISRWDTPDGNSLSVTGNAAGRIVYLESDWGYDVSGRYTDIPGLMFGVTTLDQIRERMGSNGYCHVQIGPGCVQETGNGSVARNTYGIAGTNVAITFITEMTAEAAAQGQRPGSSRLVAIILGDKEYLDGIWGSEKSTDPAYHEVRF